MHLLEAGHVRQPLNKYSFKPYHFSTAILRANKNLYRETREILFRVNGFAKIYMSAQEAFLEMREYEVAIVCNKPDQAARFQRYILCMRLKFPWEDLQKGENTVTNVVFIMLVRDLPLLVRWLRIVDTEDFVHGSAGTNFALWLGLKPFRGRNPTLMTQKAVLEPFRCLKLQWGNLIICGGVEPSYGDELSRAMMPQVYWDRANVWELYYITISIKFVADHALRMGDARLASLKYEDCYYVLSSAKNNCDIICKYNDSSFDMSCFALLRNCKVNRMLAQLKDCKFSAQYIILLREIDEVRIKNTYKFLPYEKKLLYHFQAYAWAQIGRDTAAYGKLVKAREIDPFDKHIEQDIAITKRRLDAKSDEEKLAAGELNPQQLPNKPVFLPPPTYLPSPKIACERYVLRQLGYQGNLMYQIQASEPVKDPQRLDEYARHLIFTRQGRRALVVNL